MVLVFALCAFAVISFASSGSGYLFDLNGDFWRLRRNSSSANGFTRLDLGDVLQILYVFSIIAFCSGYLRVGYLSSSEAIVVSHNQAKAYSLIGSTSSSLILKGNDGKFHLIPLSSVEILSVDP